MEIAAAGSQLGHLVVDVGDPAHHHVHHLIPWARGGGTSVEQGRLYCPRHHHKVHELMERSIRQQT